MFTGLIETIGTVVSLSRGGGFLTLGVESSIAASDITLGESIAIDGYCQTVVRAEGKTFYVEISPETLSRTTAGNLKSGSEVNLERALRLGDRLGGHLVAGHVDGVGSIARVTDKDQFRIFSIRLPEGLSRYVIEKGSVALDGISLTVNSIHSDVLEVGIIPHTISQTTLKDRKAGDSVNVEVDLVGKYIERLIPSGGEKGNVTTELLAKHGFLD